MSFIYFYSLMIDVDRSPLLPPIEYFSGPLEIPRQAGAVQTVDLCVDNAISKVRF